MSGPRELLQVPLPRAFVLVEHFFDAVEDSRRHSLRKDRITHIVGSR